MRGDDHVVALEDRMIRRERLLGEDVERGAERLARTEAHSSAGRSTGPPRAQLTMRTPSRIAAIASASTIQLTVSSSWQVQGDDVGPAVELAAGDALHLELAEALRCDELVERHDLHLERLRPAGDQLADPPKPTTPSVFPESSLPPNRERSHCPATSEPCACGTLR